MATSAPFTPASVTTLRSQVSGPVFVCGDGGLAEEVTPFNRLRRTDPQMVVGATDEADIATAVRFAAAHGLPVRLHATGHGPGAPITDGLIITTTRMDTLAIDPDTRLATIGAGVAWLRVVNAAADHGLAPVVGSSVTAGAVGYTLGGGIGPLIRSHGFSSDWVRSFRVVTAAGEVVTADAHSNTDLFWALRGGKGGLGVVAEMTVELAPLPCLYAVARTSRAATTSRPLCGPGRTGSRRRPTRSRRRSRCSECRRAGTRRSRCGARACCTCASLSRGRWARASGWSRRCAPPRPSTSTRSATCRPGRSTRSTTIRSSRDRSSRSARSSPASTRTSSRRSWRTSGRSRTARSRSPRSATSAARPRTTPPRAPRSADARGP